MLETICKYFYVFFILNIVQVCMFFFEQFIFYNISNVCIIYNFRSFVYI